MSLPTCSFKSASRTLLRPRNLAPLASRAKSTAPTSSPSSSSSDQFVLPDIILQATHPNRYEDYYHNTLAEDLMYMHYDHQLATSPETSTPPPPADLTPYERNRPKPLPLGNRQPAPKRKPLTPASVPALKSIIVHAMIKDAIGNKPALLPPLIALRGISGETSGGGGRKGAEGVQVLASKSGAAAFKLRAGMPVATKVELRGPAMYTFVQCLVDNVLPRLPLFPGFPLAAPSASTSSPSALSGVVTVGLPKEALALFPQIETNLDSYPKLTGFHISFVTGEKGKGAQERARGLLSGFRIPFARR